jgi:hypothetical protein
MPNGYPLQTISERAPSLIFRIATILSEQPSAGFDGSTANWLHFSQLLNEKH